MQWLTFIAGSAIGYKSGEPFDPFAFIAVGAFAAVIEAVVLLLFSSVIEWGWGVVPSILTDWLVLFAWGAVPCAFFGWLKQRQDRASE